MASKKATNEVEPGGVEDRLMALEEQQAASAKNIVSIDGRVETLETALENATADGEQETANGDAVEGGETLESLTLRFNTLVERLQSRVHGVGTV